MVKADSIDLMAPNALNNASLWELSSSLNDTEPAHYSTISIEESGMIISHLRPENTATSIAWASTSSTNSIAATGTPDGGVAVSKGPDIKVSGFDHSLKTSNMLLNVSLSLILTIPDVLSDDEVRFVVDRGDGTGSDAHNAFFSEFGSGDQLEAGAAKSPLINLIEKTVDKIRPQVDNKNLSQENLGLDEETSIVLPSIDNNETNVASSVPITTVTSPTMIGDTQLVDTASFVPFIEVISNHYLSLA